MVAVGGSIIKLYSVIDGIWVMDTFLVANSGHPFISVVVVGVTLRHTHYQWLPSLQFVVLGSSV